MVKVEDFKFPKDLYYLVEGNTYAKIEGDIAILGLTDYGQHLASEIEYVELPSEGDMLEQGKMLAVIESGKWSGDLKSPLSGEVVEVNSRLEDEPNLLNEDPYGEGWIVKIRPTNLEEELKKLVNWEEYMKYVEEDIKKRG